MTILAPSTNHTIFRWHYVVLRQAARGNRQLWNCQDLRYSALLSVAQPPVAIGYSTSKYHRSPALSAWSPLPAPRSSEVSSATLGRGSFSDIFSTGHNGKHNNLTLVHASRVQGDPYIWTSDYASGTQVRRLVVVSHR